MSDHLIELDEGEVMPARKRPESGDLDMTPMIDITFLLLIFFIVTSNMSKQTKADLPQAENGTTVTAVDSAVITLTPGGPEGRALVYLGDDIRPDILANSSDIGLQEDEITDYIEEQFTGSVEGGAPKVHLMIKADGKVASGEVKRAALAAMRSGAVESVERLYIGTESERK